MFCTYLEKDKLVIHHQPILNFVFFFFSLNARLWNLYFRDLQHVLCFLVWSRSFYDYYLIPYLACEQKVFLVSFTNFISN